MLSCVQGASTTTPSGGLYGGPSNYGASPAAAGPPPVYGGVSRASHSHPAVLEAGDSAQLYFEQIKKRYQAHCRPSNWAASASIVVPHVQSLCVLGHSFISSQEPCGPLQHADSLHYLAHLCCAVYVLCQMSLAGWLVGSPRCAPTTSTGATAAAASRLPAIWR